MITKAVKVSQVEAVDGKTPMTGKQSTQEKAVWNKTFQGQCEAPRESDNANTCDGWHFVNDAILPSNIQLDALWLYLHCFQNTRDLDESEGRQ